MFGDFGKGLVGTECEGKFSGRAAERESKGMRHAILVVYGKNV